MTDDEDDAPQFPWPLWLPLIVLTVHCLTFFGFMIWETAIDKFQRAEIFQVLLIVLFLSPPIYFLIGAVLQVVRGKCYSLGFIINSCGAITLIIFVPTIFLILDQHIHLLIKIILFFEFLLFLVATIIARQCESQWQNWKAYHDKRLYEDSEPEK